VLDPALLLLLALLVLELAVVEDPANRGLSVRRNLDQVELRLIGHATGVLGQDDAHLLPLFVDQPDLGDADPVVDAEFLDGHSTPLETVRRGPPRGLR
jgi:hypothetical protein